MIIRKKTDYFLKLCEETGELATAILKGSPRADGVNIKGTIEEELWDILYYVLALANCYAIDFEQWIPVKEALNNRKYNRCFSQPMNATLSKTRSMRSSKKQRKSSAQMTKMGWWTG